MPRHLHAANVAAVVVVLIGVIEGLCLCAAERAGTPVTIPVGLPIAVGAGIRFGMAFVAGADTGVGAVTVGDPCAEVVAERVTGCKGRLTGSPLGGQAAKCAGLVVDRLLGAGRGGF